ncbi:echinoidin-like [Patiria miniata]|uniref:C-type lectin domain-containing protein n=1 Tax=Patiria miniata TaxID=46514 RepID=A0A914AM80_PATMI|nr:echinoidin-like [Patiria miniata]
MERETRFVWSASSGATFTRWASDQPDNGRGKGQDCVAIRQEYNWKWDNMTCSGREEHCIPCPKRWVAFGGDCYRLVTEKLPWVEAENYCRELSNSDWFPAHLVSINSLEEQQFIVELLKASYLLQELPSVKAWLGYNDMERETRFVWSASSGANFTRWASDQPDNGRGKGQDCVAIRQEYNWKWDDMTCRFGRHFICELKMLNGRK